jgi:hypothetical protein
MDLLTVVEHEMGHVLGLVEGGDPLGVMGETLEAGIRRLPLRPAATRGDLVSSARIDPAVVDHLLQIGDRIGPRSRISAPAGGAGQPGPGFPLIAVDPSGSGSTSAAAVTLRPSAHRARHPLSVHAGRLARRPIAGGRRNRVIPSLGGSEPPMGAVDDLGG